MTESQSGWGAFNAQSAPQNNDDAFFRHRREQEDQQSKAFAFNEIELITQHGLNTITAQLEQDLMEAEEEQRVPKTVLFEHIDTLRLLVDRVVDTVEDICLKDISAIDALTAFFNDLPFSELQLDKDGLAERIKQFDIYKAEYNEQQAFPTIENDFDYIGACAADLVMTLMHEGEKSGTFDPLHLAAFEGLLNLYADLLKCIDDGQSFEHLLSAGLIPQKNSTSEQAYTLLQETLAEQAIGIELQALQLGMRGNEHLPEIMMLNVASAHLYDTRHFLHLAHSKGLWQTHFELAASIVSEELHHTAFPDGCIPPQAYPAFNEMAGIGVFFYKVRERNIHQHPDLYTGGTLAMADALAQMTLNRCADKLYSDQPAPKAKSLVPA